MGNPERKIGPGSWAVGALTSDGRISMVPDLRVPATEKMVDCTIRLGAEAEPAEAP